MAAIKRARIKTGLAGVPFDKGFEAVKFYFYHDLEKKDYVSIIKDYIKTLGKPVEKVVLSNSDYAFNFFNYAAIIYFMKAGFEVPQKSLDALERYVDKVFASGLEVMKTKEKSLGETQVSKPAISPAERLHMKVQETIMRDIDLLEDKWIENEKATIDLYKLFKQYDLKGASASIVAVRLQRWYDDMSDAYNKTCDQMVEGYSHLSRRDLGWRIDETKRMLQDLTKLDSVRKAQRKPRVKKAQAADKQVARLNFKQNDSEYKLESINPLLIIGAGMLYTFNTKTRKLTVYSSRDGFGVKGSTLQNFNEESDYTITLRKPDEVLHTILTGTGAKIKKMLDGLTTKKSTPNGRINGDTILLKAIR